MPIPMSLGTLILMASRYIKNYIYPYGYMYDILKRMILFLYKWRDGIIYEKDQVLT
jgi:hypothetical protein